MFEIGVAKTKTTYCDKDNEDDDDSNNDAND